MSFEDIGLMFGLCHEEGFESIAGCECFISLLIVLVSLEPGGNCFPFFLLIFQRSEPIKTDNNEDVIANIFVIFSSLSTEIVDEI